MLLSSLFTRTAWAQAVSLGINPPIIQIDAIPPASIKTPITIENNSEQTVRLKIVLKAFTASTAQNGMVNFLPDGSVSANPHIFDYIQFADNKHNMDSISLAPKQKKTIVMHIGIPESEPRDDYYFSVIFLSEEGEDKEQTSAKTPIGIATNVLLSLGPKDKASGQIAEFSAPFFIENGPVPFTLRLKNTSNHYITPRGVIMIRNVFNQTIGRVDLLPVNVLSGTTRAIPDILLSPEQATKAAAFVRPQTRFEAAVWPETFLLGPYTAELTLVLSDQGPVFRRNVYFFAFPMWLLIGIAIGILIGISIYLRVKKKLK